MSDPPLPVSRLPVRRAAGAVLWRAGSAGDVEIALTRASALGGAEGGWRLPEARLGPCETEVEAAARALREGVGLTAPLGRTLGGVRRETGGVRELVAYWEVEALAPAPERVRWVAVAQAAGELDAQGAQAVAALRAGPAQVTRLLLLRHAEAAPPGAGPDSRRSLSDIGRRRAARIADVAAAIGVDELRASPARRCAETLAPAADRLGVPLTADPLLAEDADPADALAALTAPLDGQHRTVLVCSHAPTVGRMLDLLAEGHPGLVPRPARLDPGGAWSAEFGRDGLAAMVYLQPPPIPGED